MSKKQKMKVTKSIGYNSDRPKDGRLMAKINTFASLPENDGIDAQSLIRNFLCKKLDEEIELINSSRAVQTA